MTKPAKPTDLIEQPIEAVEPPRKNCWTCAHCGEIGPPPHDGKCHATTDGRAALWWAIRSWCLDHNAMGPNMPSRDADGCPGWSGEGP